MKILNFGSLNIDHVYQVDHFTRPGETQAAKSYARFAGGKGCNQSVALARAGAEVLHAGRVGADGLWLRELLEKAGADTSLLLLDEGPSGHAIIQVDGAAENSITLFGGANRKIDSAQIETAIGRMSPGDAILLQNEINAMPEIIRAAAKAKLKIFLNPAPMGPEVKSYPLALVSCLVVNEIEGEELSGEKAPERSISKLRKLYPNTEIMLTLGSKGARLEGPEGSWQVDAVKAKAVDTTAAGDTFIGYYLAGLAEGLAKPEAMKLAVKAAALTVSRKGAAESIPFRGELV